MKEADEIKQRISLIEACKRVLHENSGTPMRSEDIWEKIQAGGYFSSRGKTPAATVGSKIYESIKTYGKESPFLQTGKNLFTLNKGYSDENIELLSTTGNEKITKKNPHKERIIKCYGMYWQRSNVNWTTTNIKLLGKLPKPNTSNINFAQQRGVYILYDGHTPVYVGRVTDRDLANRLCEHTKDRISHRWTSFSWFGLLNIDENKKSTNMNLELTLNTIIIAFENLLIEALEPPQNRRGSEDFSTVEYIQVMDPGLKNQQLEKDFKEILGRYQSNTNI